MKKLQASHYIILLAICVTIVTVIVALTMGKDAALSVLPTGIGCIIGLIIGTIIRKNTDVGKAVDELSPRSHRRLVTFLIIGAVLTMVAVVLLTVI